MGRAGRAEGSRPLEDLEKELTDHLYDLDLQTEAQAAAYGYAYGPAGIEWHNSLGMFKDDDLPLRPFCSSRLEQECAETIVRLSLIDALRKAGCEKRLEAVKWLRDALGLSDKSNRASELFNKPWEMGAEQVWRLEKAADIALNDLRGVGADRMMRREAQRAIQHLQTDVLLMRGERLSAAMEIVKAARAAIKAMNVTGV